MTTAPRALTRLAALLSLSLLHAAPAPAAGDPFTLAAPALMQTLGATSAMPSDAIDILTNEIAEAPSLVPIQVRSRLPQTESMTIVLENNPTPLAARYRLLGQMDPVLSTRVRIPKTTPIHVIVQAGGKTYRASKVVKVTRGGCGDGSIVQNKPTASDAPAGAIRLRAARADGGWEIKSILQHPMENGLRPVNDEGDMAPARDSRTGKPIVPHYIREVSATLDGKPVFRSEWGPSIAVNPFLSFRLPGAQPGQTVQLTWKDTLGQSGSGTLRLE